MGTYENPFEVNNELKNRYTHIRHPENIEKTSVENDKNFGTKEKTSVQILDLMKENPSITLQQIAEKIGLSKRAIEMQVKKLREQGKVNRIGATKKRFVGSKRIKLWK